MKHFSIRSLSPVQTAALRVGPVALLSLSLVLSLLSGYCFARGGLLVIPAAF